jgi:hypothetical protein
MRLARWALARTYGQEIPFSGPLLKSATIEDDLIRVDFEHTGGGLMVARKEGIEPARPTPDAALAHFELADGAASGIRPRQRLMEPRSLFAVLPSPTHKLFATPAAARRQTRTSTTRQASRLRPSAATRNCSPGNGLISASRTDM